MIEVRIGRNGGFATYIQSINKFVGDKVMCALMENILARIGPHDGPLIPAFVDAIRKKFPDLTDDDIYFEYDDSSGKKNKNKIY